MADGPASAVVSTAWLSDQLSRSPSNIKVLDSSATPLLSGESDFLGKHIPGAQFFHLLECTTPTTLIPRNLPDPAGFQRYVRSLGVNKDDYVVVYDRGNIVASCRAWWTFRIFGHERVAVLDGGLQKWEEEKLDTETGKPRQPEGGDFEAMRNNRLIKTFEDVVEMAKSRSHQIVDTRFPGHFCGDLAEPAPAAADALRGVGLPQPTIKKGHVIGAMNLFYDLVFDDVHVEKYKVLLDKARLLKVFQEAGVDLEKPMITMCYIGHTSTLVALAAHVCGKTEVPSYYGSWTEFGQRGEDGYICGPAAARS